jgi:hypothetical protein
MKEAQIVANYIGKNHTATYAGNHTATASGDIILEDGTAVEVKRVTAGSGTYDSPSIYYFEKFGFDFRDYMKKFNFYDALEEAFGKDVKISRTNKSPVSQKDSSFIRHSEEYKEVYQNKILPLDAEMRKAFTEDLANYFRAHPQDVYTYISDMLSKNTATSKKQAPDRMIVFNYNKQEITELNIKEILKNNDCSTVRNTDLGLVIGNIRVAISWQNGAGLNNPTARVYIIKGEK